MKSKPLLSALAVVLSFVAFGAGFLTSARSNILLLSGEYEAASNLSIVSLAILIAGAVITIGGAVLSRKWARAATEKPENLWIVHGMLLCFIIFQVWYITLGIVGSFL